jgi:O-antigen/teichoic acid export membrane protein
MTSERSSGWTERALVLIGRGASGVLSVLVFGFLSRSAGLDLLGIFAAVYLTAQAVAEVADISSQRHVTRLLAAGAADSRSRLEAFQALRIRTLVSTAAIALVLTLAGAREHLAVNLAVLPAAVGAFAAHTYYATALALRQYRLIAIGPAVSLLATALGLALFPAVASLGALWTAVAAIHAGRVAELLLLRFTLPWIPARADRVRIRREWREVRFLFFQSLLSAGNARLIVPLVGLAVGAEAAGLLSLGMSLLAVISLFAVALVLPAYRAVLDRPLSRSLLAAFRYSKRDWGTATGVGVALSAGLAIFAASALAPLLGLPAWHNRVALRLIVLGGAFEPLTLFAGALFQACHRDRSLFSRSVVTMSLNWVAVLAGARFGVIGMAAALLASRGAGAAVLCWPLVAEHGAAARLSRAGSAGGAEL